MKEDFLLTGLLEPSNEAYSIAKIAGIKMCESYNKQFSKEYGISFRSIMPTNLYGVGDNYHPKNSHVIPALIRKVHEAKIENKALTVWGSGKAMREFLYVDDLASACIFMMNIENSTYEKVVDLNCSHLNVGYGEDISIKHLVYSIAKVIGYSGDINFDDSLPEGIKRKLLDSKKLNTLGWKPKVNLINGLEATYKDYLQKEKL